MRPRTRAQWDQHYRNLYEEQKKKMSGRRGKRPVQNVVEPEPVTVLDEDSDDTMEKKPDFGERRTRSGVHKFNLQASAAGNKKQKKKKKKEETNDHVRDRNESDDDSIEFLGHEKVVSIGSGSKIKAELRAGSASNPLDIDSGSSSSDNESLSEDESSSEEEEEEEEEGDEESEERDESDDEDYKADKPSATSQSSDDDDTDDFEQEKDDECDGGGGNENPMTGEEEIDRGTTTRRDDPIKGVRVNDERREGETEEDDIYDDGENNEDVMKWEEEIDRETTTPIKGARANEAEKDDNYNGGDSHDNYDGGENDENVMTGEDEIDLEKTTRCDPIKGVRVSEKRKSETGKDKESDLKKREAFDKRNDKEDTCFTKEEVENDKFSSKRDEYSCLLEHLAGMRDPRRSEKVGKLGKKKTREEKSRELTNILVEAINYLKLQKFPTEENAAFTQTTLSWKFRFEDDEMQPPPEKTDSEKEIESLFHELEFGLRESEIDHYPAMMENDDERTGIDTTPAACCGRGEHQPILDEQIGIVCEYCAALIMDIKYVLPPFHTPRPRRREGKDTDDDSPNSNNISQIHFQDSVACETAGGPTSRAKGTVWDLIPGVEEEMYPHQREGFEFMWRNLAGDILIENLKHRPLGRGGCIISHAPGTGKTRLAIVFLAAFLKLYPTCRPVVIAPKGMLLTWESEFEKWNANIPFHNMNKEELSENENAFAAVIIAQIGGVALSREHIRWLKMCKWMRGGSILGISYQLFEKLTGENRRGEEKNKMRELLLKYPGLLVLDEGHTPRNDHSLIWKALTKVENGRCIILSGTPFQNNLVELYNILCLVNPSIMNCESSCETANKFARKRWRNLASCIDSKNRDDGLKKLKVMLDPFVHVHKGTILQESLRGLSDTLVFLKPTQLQKTLLETSAKVQQVFSRIRLVSMVSVHPSLLLEEGRSTAHRSQLEAIESDIEAGVKTQFVMKLISLADALGERVLIFSQFIDPLMFVKKQIKSHFSWNEGRELLYMDGQLDEKQRQDSISSFNNEASEAKVLLASERACSEGISLVGASRVVLLDTVWNPSVEKQAISRAYRLGQKKVVYVYRLFTSGTEVKQYAQQVRKKRLSQLIFSPVDGEGCRGDKSNDVPEDKVLGAMLRSTRFRRIFEKIIHQPKESDLIENFELVGLK